MFGNLFLIVLFLELSLAQIQRAPLPTRVIIAVNAGGPAHRWVIGILFFWLKFEILFICLFCFQRYLRNKLCRR